MIETDTDNETLEISKSQRKRDAHELLDLAKQMVSMTESKLAGLPLDEELRDAIGFARSIKAHGAKKRQLMTVGKMLRQRDNQTLLDALHQEDHKARQANARFHHIESWRDRLCAGGDQDLSELLAQTPSENAQALRQLIRNARREAERGKPPASARKLFKLLREMDEESPLPPL